MELGSMLFYESLLTLLGPLLSFRYRMRTEGADNVPAAGGAILASNHRSWLDPCVLAYASPRPVNFAAGSHLYGVVPGVDKLFNMIGFFPMHIYGGDEGDRSLDNAARLLSRGEVIGIFPEGIESFMYVERVSKITSFKTGFVKVALDNRVPIIPAAIHANEEKKFLFKLPGMLVTPFVDHPTAKDGVKLITYRQVTCRFGRPVDLSPYYERTVTKNLMDDIAGKVRKIVVKLYDGQDLDRLVKGDAPFDFVNDSI